MFHTPSLLYFLACHRAAHSSPSTFLSFLSLPFFRAVLLVSRGKQNFASYPWKCSGQIGLWQSKAVVKIDHIEFDNAVALERREFENVPFFNVSILFSPNPKSWLFWRRSLMGEQNENDFTTHIEFGKYKKLLFPQYKNYSSLYLPPLVIQSGGSNLGCSARLPFGISPVAREGLLFFFFCFSQLSY